MAPLEPQNEVTQQWEAPEAPVTKANVGDAWKPVSVSIDADAADLSGAIKRAATDGLMIVNNVGTPAPFQAIGSLMDTLKDKPELPDRANRAYPNNLVYKDSHQNGKGGDHVDEKRVFDFSDDRVEIMQRKDDQLIGDMGEDFPVVQSFFAEKKGVTVKILSALKDAVGGGGAVFDPDSIRRNYRVADYYRRSAASEAPRCGEHRDFGQFTLIFPDDSGNGAGLQIYRESEAAWVDVPLPPAGGAILVFGICTAWASNGRINAVKHRVVNAPGQSGAEVNRRLSAVLFVGPQADVELAPVLAPGERRRWKTGAVKEVRPLVARKWRHREGTTDEAEEKEEEELKEWLPTQDDAIEFFYKIPPGEE